jgi:L-2-hydroxyglutarate oxidase LhgO
MLALLGDLEHAGGLLALNSGIHHAHPSADWSSGAMVLVANDGTELAATTVVNAAGLYAPALARQFQGLDARHVPPRSLPRAATSRCRAVRPSGG